MTEAAIESNKSLAERLRARIRREGTVSFYEWMKAALYDERDGYYCRSDRVRQGRAGDYRTAPETSPLFAATFANYFSRLFRELNRPPAWTIFEAGAGSGDFAHGILSRLRDDAPEVFAASRYVIDEVSPAACRRAAERLSGFADRVSFRPFNETETAETGIVFSNELIDALPVHRVIMRAGDLRQFYVGLEAERFVWIEGNPEPRLTEYCKSTQLQLIEGQIAEINLDAEEFVQQAARLIRRGFVITVDYGAERKDLLGSRDRDQGTLRAFRRHRLIESILENPGEQDLTTTIDWTQLREAGTHAGLQAIRFERLDKFLIAEGLLTRLSEIASSTQDTAEAMRLTTSARELILPTGLAASFQVLVQEKK